MNVLGDYVLKMSPKYGRLLLVKLKDLGTTLWRPSKVKVDKWAADARKLQVLSDKFGISSTCMKEILDRNDWDEQRVIDLINGEEGAKITHIEKIVKWIKGVCNNLEANSGVASNLAFVMLEDTKLDIQEAAKRLLFLRGYPYKDIITGDDMTILGCHKLSELIQKIGVDMETLIYILRRSDWSEDCLRKSVERYDEVKTEKNMNVDRLSQELRVNRDRIEMILEEACWNERYARIIAEWKFENCSRSDTGSKRITDMNWKKVCYHCPTLVAMALSDWKTAPQTFQWSQSDPPRRKLPNDAVRREKATDAVDIYCRIVDLHGRGVQDACRWVLRKVKELKTNENERIVFITGQGHHSISGRPEIRSAITQVLVDAGYTPYLQEGNRGRVVIPAAIEGRKRRSV